MILISNFVINCYFNIIIIINLFIFKLNSQSFVINLILKLFC